VAQLVSGITAPAPRTINIPRMQKKRFVLAGALALAAVLGFAATPAGMAPLPAQYLHGGIFHSPDKWFQIELPANWEWFEMRAFDGEADPRWPDGAHDAVAWMVRDPKTFDDVVVMETYNPGGDFINGAYAADFETRTRRAVAPEVMSDFSSELLTIAGEQSLHYRYKLTSKTRPALYRFGYATGMEHKVFVTTSDKTAQEPPLLRRVALSMRWLQVP
jgi:hypothetical protein